MLKKILDLLINDKVDEYSVMFKHQEEQLKQEENQQEQQDNQQEQQEDLIQEEIQDERENQKQEEEEKEQIKEELENEEDFNRDLEVVKINLRLIEQIEEYRSQLDDKVMNKNFSMLKMLIKELVKKNFISCFLYILELIQEQQISQISPFYTQCYHVLTIICQNNLNAQGLLFDQTNFFVIKQLYRYQGVYVSLMIKEIFKRNYQLLYINPHLFEQIINIYSDNLYMLLERFKSYRDNNMENSQNQTIQVSEYQDVQTQEIQFENENQEDNQQIEKQNNDDQQANDGEQDYLQNENKEEQELDGELDGEQDEQQDGEQDQEQNQEQIQSQQELIGSQENSQQVSEEQILDENIIDNTYNDTESEYNYDYYGGQTSEEMSQYEDYDNQEELSQEQEQIILMFTVQFLQELFINTLEMHRVKTKNQRRIDLLLSEKMFEFIGDILKRFIETENLQEKLTFSSALLSDNNFNNFAENINYLDMSDPDYYFYYNILKLFNKTNYYVFKKNNLKKVKPLIEQFIQKVFSYNDNPDLINMRSEVIKLYNYHLLEKENNLITFFTDQIKEKDIANQSSYDLVYNNDYKFKIDDHIIKKYLKKLELQKKAQKKNKEKHIIEEDETEKSDEENQFDLNRDEENEGIGKKEDDIDPLVIQENQYHDWFEDYVQLVVKRREMEEKRQQQLQKSFEKRKEQNIEEDSSLNQGDQNKDINETLTKMDQYFDFILKNLKWFEEYYYKTRFELETQAIQSLKIDENQAMKYSLNDSMDLKSALKMVERIYENKEDIKTQLQKSQLVKELKFARSREISSEIVISMRRFLIKTFYPMIYKFIKIIDNSVNLNIPRNKIEDYTKLIQLLKRVLQIFEQKYKIIYKPFKYNPPQESELFKFTNKIHPLKMKTKTQELDHQEEKHLNHLRIFREECQSTIKYMKSFFNDESINYLIERYKIKYNQEKINDNMKEQFLSSYTIQGLIKHQNKKTQLIKHQRWHQSLFDEKSPLYSDFKFLKKSYEDYLIYFNDKLEKNQFFNVIMDSKNKRYMRTLIQYFIDMINSINIDMSIGENDNTQVSSIEQQSSVAQINRRSFFTNENFFYLYIVLDNMIQWEPEVKKEFVQYITKNQDKSKSIHKFLQNTWIFLLNLYHIVTFKPFHDDNWDHYWGKFYVLKTFLSNLTDVNNEQFKDLLSKTFLGNIFERIFKSKNPYNNQRQFQSLFGQLFLLLEKTVMQTNFWDNNNEKINPSDKSQVFIIIKELMDLQTNFITGISQNIKLQFYSFRSDIWKGIINKVIDDTDSRFYEIKLSCIIYINALFEDFNQEILNFLIGLYQVDQLYGLIIRLMRKLVIRKQKMDQFKKDDMLENIMQISEVTHQEEDQLVLQENQLLFLYQSHVQEFSNHILMEIVIRIYILLKTVSYKIKFYYFFLNEKEQLINKKSLKPRQLQEKYILQFLNKIVKNVEVVHEGILQKQYFKKEPRCFMLCQFSKDLFIQNINITTTQSKNLEMIMTVPYFDQEIIFNQKNYQISPYFYIFLSKSYYYYNQLILYLILVAMNIYMMFFMDLEDYSNPNDTLSFNNSTQQKGFYLLIGLIAGISMVLTMPYTFFKAKLLVKYDKLKISIEQQIPLKRMIQQKRQFMFQLWKAFSNPEILSYYVNISLMILAIFYTPFFLTLNLFLIFNMSNTINYIFKSIIIHSNKLIITLLMIILLIFSYSFLLLTYFSSEFNTNDDPNLGTICENFFACFINTVNQGMKQGGGIADILYLQVDVKTGVFWERFFFDVSFFILIQLIFLNIFSGIIIDTFSEMRQEMNLRNYHEQNKCHICGINKWQVIKRNNNFQYHREYTHNFWNYVYFIVNLKEKEDQRMTALEFKINEKISEKDISWIPFQEFLKPNESFKKIKIKDRNEEEQIDIQ